jgi:uncharacterized membrane protein
VVRHDSIGDALLRTVKSLPRTATASLVRHRRISVITVAALALYLLISLTRHRSYLTDGYDLGIFDQVVRAYAHFKAPISPLKGQGYNIYGDHFHPIIALLAPLYWIWDNPCSLLIGQSVVMAVAIPVVYRFTRRRTSEPMALVISATFAVGWPVLSLVDFDFHEIAFATPLMALAIDALDRRDDRRLLLWSGLLLLVREDMGVLVGLLGLFVLFRGGRAGLRARLANPRSASAPAALVVAGITAYKITTGLVLPAFAPNHKFAYWQYDSLGHNLPDAVFGILTRPWHAVDLFFTPELKTQTLCYFLLPLLLLPLRSPYALLSLPIFAERFFNSRESKEYLWSTHWQYNALPWLILMLAAVDGAARFGLFRSGRGPEICRRVFAVWLLVVPVFLALWSNGATPRPPNPIRRLTGSAWDTTDRLKSQRAAAAFVPSDVCVEADDRIVPHLTSRAYASLPGMQDGTADFVVLDLSEDNVGNFGPSPQKIEQDDLAAGYTEVFRQGTMLVLRSPHYRGPSTECKPLGRGR